MKIVCLLLALLIPATACASSNYVQIKNDTTLYYEEAGSGQTIVFIPGWTFPHDVFYKKIDYFSKNYHVLAIDPRSQGLSEVNLENNR